MKVFLVAVMCLSAGNLYGAPELEKQVAELNKKIEKLEKLIGQLAKQHSKSIPQSSVGPQPIPQISEVEPSIIQSSVGPQPIPQINEVGPSTILPFQPTGQTANRATRYNAPGTRHSYEPASPRTVPFDPNAPLPKGWQRLNLNEQYYIFIVPVDTPRPEHAIRYPSPQPQLSNQ